MKNLLMSLLILVSFSVLADGGGEGTGGTPSGSSIPKQPKPQLVCKKVKSGGEDGTTKSVCKIRLTNRLF